MNFFDRARAGFAMATAAGIFLATSMQPAVAQPVNAANEQHVNGWNVVRANYDGGIFQRTSPGQWTEFNDGGATFTFEERSRDDWSVYLYDRARNVSLQIDMHRNMISAGTGDAPRIDIYEITGSAAGAVTGNPLVDAGITGHNVVRVEFDGGSFRSLNSDEWVELGDNGGAFQFRETGRGDWSVNLHDASRNVRLRIDIQRQMIMITNSYGTHTDLYPITSATR